MPKKTANLKYYESVGRRKEAVARIRMYIAPKNKYVTVEGMKMKAGEISVNKKPIAVVFGAVAEKSRYLLPLRSTQSEDRFAIVIHVRGGGKAGQLDAIREVAVEPPLRDAGIFAVQSKAPLARQRERLRRQRLTAQGQAENGQRAAQSQEMLNWFHLHLVVGIITRPVESNTAQILATGAFGHRA